MNPAVNFGLWDIVDGAIVTTHGALCGIGEVEGLSPTATASDTWYSVADNFYSVLRGIDDGVFLQALYCRGRVDSETLARLMPSDADSKTEEGNAFAPVFGYQRAKRLEFLQTRKLRSRRTFLVWGSMQGLTGAEFAEVSRKIHEKQLASLDKVERQVLGACAAAQLSVRKLPDHEIVALFQSWLDPRHRHQRRPRCAPRRESPLLDDAALQAEPQLRPLSIREQLFPGNVQWDPHWVRIDSTFFKVLTLKSLPPSTSLGLFDLPRDRVLPLSDLEFDYRLCVYVHFPNQPWAQRGFRQRRRFAYSLAQSEGVSDAAAEAADEDLESLAAELARGEKLVKVGAQVVVWSGTVSELERRATRLADALRNKLGIEVFEESWAHDRELPKTFPGLGLIGFDRWKLTKSAVVGDFLPIANYSWGDPQPTVVLEDADSHQPFGWSLRDAKRANDNFQIFGGSGAGKSVLINILLAYGVLSGPTKGRVLALDYAGPEKSSFRVAAEVFGGKYIPIAGDGKKINPWPIKAAACDGSGKMLPDKLAYLTQLTNILLHNAGDTREEALSTRLVQAAIQRLYERWSSPEQPLYTDFLRALESYPVDERSDQKRREDLIKLTRKVLDGPESALLNERTTADTTSDFIVYDLFGLQSYDERVKNAVGLVVTTQVRNTAFDGRPDRLKYIFFEEAAQLLSVGMRGTIEELFATARAHGTAVATITQEYDAYRRSGIAGVINLNTTSTIFLSHAEAANAIAPIIEDFRLNQQEAAILGKLTAVRGEYSEQLIRTHIRDPQLGSRSVTAKTRLYLSPFDYQVVTSSADDRTAQRKLRESYPDRPLVQILDYLAYGRKKQ